MNYGLKHRELLIIFNSYYFYVLLFDQCWHLKYISTISVYFVVNGIETGKDDFMETFMCEKGL